MKVILRKTKNNMGYEIHHANVNLIGDIPLYFYESEIVVNAHILTRTTPNCVYLISINEEILITENQLELIKFAQRPGYNPPSFLVKEVLNSVGVTTPNCIIFLQEYNSYEEAYQVALDMKEVNPKCYTPES